MAKMVNFVLAISYECWYVIMGILSYILLILIPMSESQSYMHKKPENNPLHIPLYA